MSKGDPPSRPDQAGHRERLRDRFMKSGSDAVSDYELLELLLFPVIQRGDVKPSAKALLRRFDSFAGVLAASPAELQKIKGIGPQAAHALKVAQAAAIRMAREKVYKRPVLSSWNAVLDYVRVSMGFENIEQFRVLFLDKKNALLADEVQQKGTIDHTPLYPREVIRRSLEIGASAIILVHNHPSGDPTPSPADIDMTREVAEAGAKLGVTVHDHIIVARTGHVSLKSKGLL
ncbi:MAG: DNA repair protein RadC [Alphaproteobacteria bacterium]